MTAIKIANTGNKDFLNISIKITMQTIDILIKEIDKKVVHLNQDEYDTIFGIIGDNFSDTEKKAEEIASYLKVNYECIFEILN